MSNDFFSNPQNEKAGLVGMAFSFIFPLIGVILYFVNRKSVCNPNAYLKSALAGFVVGMLLRVLSMGA